MTENRFRVLPGQRYVQALTSDPEGPVLTVRGPAWVSRGPGGGLLVQTDDAPSKWLPETKPRPGECRCGYYSPDEKGLHECDYTRPAPVPGSPARGSP